MRKAAADRAVTSLVSGGCIISGAVLRRSLLFALIHDAVLIAAPVDRLDHDIKCMRDAMAKPHASCSTASNCAPTSRTSAIRIAAK
jgi:hypothetical protein